MAMNLQTITVEPEVARDRLAAYKEAAKITRNQEDLAIARAYQAASKGKPIIVLNETVKAGGYVDGANYLPRLAVCRADAKRCIVNRNRERLVFTTDDGVDHRRAEKHITAYHVVIDWPDDQRAGWQRAASAMVPITPPEHRPRRGLAGYHVLWEAEWSPAPPTDPALLKHVGGDLWIVHATWDLTDLERAVIAGTRR